MAATVAYHRSSSDAVLSSSSQGVTVNAAQCTGMGGVTRHNANGSASTALVHKEKQDKKNSSALVSSSPSSCAMTLLTAVERSVLRTLAFVFYQLDREQAKYCASSILRWYFQLQAQLPVSAVESLERVAASVISLSDAKFTSFWLSLLEKEIEIELDDADDEFIGCSSSTLESRITIQSYEEDAEEQGQQAKREKTLIRRLYQHIYCSIQGLFFANRSGHSSKSNERGRATQTPCTSPTDLSDDSHYQKAHRRKTTNRYVRYEGDDDSNDEFYMSSQRGDEYSNSIYDHDQYSDDDSDNDDDGDDNDDLFESGWAVEYMEQQESTVSTELTRRMRKMMHSSIPLNLFRVTVAYSSEPSGEVGEGGFVGVISPESFPPTPITRDLQTRRMNCYTASVLDHTTLALRLLEANHVSSSSSSSSTGSASQQLR